MLEQTAAPVDDPSEGPELVGQPAAPSLEGSGTSVLLFRNDLRLRDNEALVLANTAQLIVPLYVFDRSHFSLDHASPHGFERTGAFRANFLRQAVDDVRDCIIRLGSDMVVRIGDTVEELSSIVEALLENGLGPIHFVAHRELAPEEAALGLKIESALRELAEKFETEIGIHWIWGSTMHHLDDVPFSPAAGGLPATFDAYRALMDSEDGSDVRDELPAPERMVPYPMHIKLPHHGLPHLEDDLGVEGVGEPNDFPFPDHRAVMGFKGGPTEGEKRVRAYIWERERLREYAKTRDGSGTQDFSTKFSPWLAAGCLSPRMLFWELKRFEMDVIADENTQALEEALMRRDYARWAAAAAGASLFAHGGSAGGGQQPVWTLPADETTNEQLERLTKWKDGATGIPFVDACMRELRFTGYMSALGRRVTASFLAHDLGFPDWRAGAEYFEAVLIDFDVALNWGNWAKVAGVGQEPSDEQRLNVVEQGVRSDPDGWYIRAWCHELRRVPEPHIHQPHRMTEEECEEYQVEMGVDYPLPIVALTEAVGVSV